MRLLVLLINTDFKVAPDGSYPSNVPQNQQLSLLHLTFPMLFDFLETLSLGFGHIFIEENGRY